MPTDPSPASAPALPALARFRVELLPDYDASPDDCDCYDPDDLAAYERGEWRYVGVVVHATFGRGVTVDVETTGLWGVEVGLGDPDESTAYVRSVAVEQWAEARAELPWLPELDVEHAEIVEQV